MPPSKPISEIPTLSDLYESGQLQPSEHDDDDSASRPKASAALNAKVSLIRTSITTLATTSIVNAANESLLGGGGVDGAIHSAAGPSLLAECRTLNGCPTGSAKLTSAYDLPSKYIIHAVGPIYHRTLRHISPAELLTSCYRQSLRLAAEKGGSIAFSCLSTGIYGYPSGEAAEVACTEVRRFLEEDDGGRLERVVFCCFEAKDERAYGVWLPKIFPPANTETPPTAKPTSTTTSTTNPTQPPNPLPNTTTTTTTSPPPSSPLPKKPKTEDISNISKDWETLDKPFDTPSNLSISEKATTDVSDDEGEKVEAPRLADEEGEKVEKEGVDELAESGEVLPRSGLLKDW